MPSSRPAAKVRLLRPIRVLVVSRDRRYLGVLDFLLARKNLVVESSRRPRELLGLVERGVDVVVLDGSDSLAAAAEAVAELEALHPEIGVIVVAERRKRAGTVFRPLPKWGSPQRLADEIERVYLRLHPRERAVSTAPRGRPQHAPQRPHGRPLEPE